MRIVIDEDLCLGHGECQEIAPEVFEVGDSGLARVLIDEPEPELRDKVENAVRYCPAKAITFIK